MTAIQHLTALTLVVCMSLIFPRSAFDAPSPSFGSVSKPDVPVGLTSWQDQGSSDTSNDSSATYVINKVTEPVVTVTAPTLGILTHETTGDTLATTYRLTADVYIAGSQSGVENTAANQAQGLNNFVSRTSFLSPGIQVLDAGGDNRVNIVVTSRGRNAEDFGSDNDGTEAPDTGEYDADVTLRLSW